MKKFSSIFLFRQLLVSIVSLSRAIRTVSCSGTLSMGYQDGVLKQDWTSWVLVQLLSAGCKMEHFNMTAPVDPRLRPMDHDILPFAGLTPDNPG